MPESIYLIDAYSLIFQVFHAIPEMTGPAGQPTNAVFGFTRDLINLRRDRKPDYWAAALDPEGPTFRDELFPAYKAERGPMPDELAPQIPVIFEIMEAFRLPMLVVPRYEADDVLATLAVQAAAKGMQVFLVTGDKDMRQLINDRVKVFNIRKQAAIDAAALEADWGIRPDQVIDYLAMVGDHVDGIPGIPLIGPKKAAALLQKYGTLDAVLEHVDDIAGTKLQANIRAGGVQARLSRQLATLVTDVPLEIDWEACRVREPDYARLRELFERCGFRRFADEIGAPPPTAPRWEGDYRTAADAPSLAKLAQELRAAKALGVELVAGPGRAMEAPLIGLAITAATGEAAYVPLGGDPAGKPREARLFEDAPPPHGRHAALETLRSLLEAPDISKAGHDLKRAVLLLRRHGVRLAGIGLDCMLAGYLLEAGQRNHDLPQLVQRYLQQRLPATTESERPPSLGRDGDAQTRRRRDAARSGAASQTKAGAPAPAATPGVPKAVAPAPALLAGAAADAALRLAPVLEKKLRDDDLWSLYSNVERPLINVLADMEFHGVRVDIDLLRRLSDDFTARLQQLRHQVHELAGGPFNLGSPIQLREVLFERLKLPAARKTKTGASTDQTVLEELANLHPLPRLLLEHRKLAKLKNTYVDALPHLVNPNTGRIHATFQQAVAATGRLSSADPNLQNIPVRGEDGRQIRQAFIPGRPGWQLLCADYSQVELRILAHYSGDPELRRAFAEDHDIHAYVAAQVFRVPESEVTADMRRIAKTVNFGIMYGLSPFGLARRLGIPQDEAAQFIDDYFARYRGVEDFFATALAAGRADGYVKTILGRRRAIRGIRPVAGRQRNLPERTAINTVIQGSAADLIKLAMIRSHRRMQDANLAGKMLLQIHDELVFESPPEETALLARLVRDEMTGALPLSVPLKVDLAVGPNWLDVTPL